MAASRGRNRDSLPSNINVEKAVLGAALVNTETFYKITTLAPEDFYSIKHQTIFKAILSVNNDKKNIDIYTVCEALASMNELNNVGGVNYLQELVDSVVSLSNIQNYIDIINDESTLRKLLNSIRSIDKRYLETDIDNPNDFILDAEKEIKDALAHRKVSTFKKVNDIANEIGVELANSPYEELILNGDEVSVGRFNTGYKNINRVTDGFARGEVTIVAARPSVGKTTLSMNFAYHVASKSHKPVAIFSLEMTSDLLVKKLISMVSTVNVKLINSGRLGKDNEIRRKVASACKEIANLPIFIDDSSNNRVLDITTKVRKLISTEKDVGLVVIDYLGLVNGGSGSKESRDASRQEEVRKISQELKAMAKELNIPVVIVSQLSRNVENRGESKKPMMSDLRDSGSIEQDADVIMLLYRADYYDDGEGKKAGDKKGGKLSIEDKHELVMGQQRKELMESMSNSGLGATSLVEINIAKNRNGQTGRCYLFFHKDCARFDQPPAEWEKAIRELDEKSSKGE